jgi:hypothetical protein
MNRLRPQCTAAVPARPVLRAGRRLLADAATLLAAAGLTTAGLIAAGTGTASAAPAAPTPVSQAQTFGVQPATAAKPDRRPNFTFTASPGGILTDHLAVSNISLKPLSLRVYARDAFNTPDGGFDVLTAGRKAVDLGAWVTVDNGLVTVAARSKKIVAFRLKVPANAAPGDHAGGIVASLTSVTRNKDGNPVTLDQRVGARIYLRVTGPLRPNLTVTGMRTDYRGTANPAGCGDLGVSYQVNNGGNVRLSGHQRVRVSGPFGSGAKTQDVADLPELLPGNVVTVNTTVHCVRPTVRVEATATVNPLLPAGDISAAAPSAVGHSGFWALPWVGVGMLLVLFVLGGLYWRQHRRDQPTPAAPHRPRETVSSSAGDDG